MTWQRSPACIAFGQQPNAAGGPRMTSIQCGAHRQRWHRRLSQCVSVNIQRIYSNSNAPAAILNIEVVASCVAILANDPSGIQWLAMTPAVVCR